MKKVLYLFAAMALFASCKNETKTADATTKKDPVDLPYKPTYSSDFVLSDSTKYLQATLQSYKDWEDNKLNNAPAYFGDTVSMDFSDGSKYKLLRDSIVKVFQKYRDSLRSSKIEMAGWLNLHAVDKKQDWVCVWYKQTDTFKTGKVDSSFYQDNNLIVNGKIVYVMSQRRSLKPKK
jgi:hypothetical protein